MKKLTEQIKTMINSDIIEKIEELIAKGQWPNYEYQEMGLEETLDNTKQYFSVLEESINRGILDEMSFHFRQNLV